MVQHHHKLYGLVVIMLLMQLSSFIFLTGRTAQIDSRLTATTGELKTSLENELKALEKQSQSNFQEISQTLSRQQQEQSVVSKQLSELKTQAGDFSELIEDKVKGVVSVGTESAGGSGFFIANRYVATNYHVVQGAQKIAVLTYDKQIFNAQLIGFDSLRDIALLKIDASYPVLKLGDSDKLQVGNKVIAIGNPLGLSFTVTAGIVSALNREGKNGLSEYIQTDVSLNPGNSGGPLIDTAGDVIGINNFKVGNAESIGFALESNVVKASINKIANTSIA